MELSFIMLAIFMVLMLSARRVLKLVNAVKEVCGMTHMLAVKKKLGSMRSQKVNIENAEEWITSLVDSRFGYLLFAILALCLMWIALAAGMDLSQLTMFAGGLIVAGGIVKCVTTQIPLWIQIWADEMAVVVLDDSLDFMKERLQWIKERVETLAETSDGGKNLTDEEKNELPTLLIEASKISEEVIIEQQQKIALMKRITETKKVERLSDGEQSF